MTSRTTHSLDSIYEREHFVQLYEDETALYANLNRFIGGGLKNSDACVVIATPEHISALSTLLEQAGFDLQTAKQQKKLLMVDAADILSRFMADGLPDRVRFKQVIGQLLEELDTGGKTARAFGEMVALLWQQHNQAAAVLLEQLWNEIAQDYSFTLYCAYPNYYFEAEAQVSAIREITRLHSSLVRSKPSQSPAYKSIVNETAAPA